jgi:hypothetical protein
MERALLKQPHPACSPRASLEWLSKQLSVGSDLDGHLIMRNSGQSACRNLL